MRELNLLPPLRRVALRQKHRFLLAADLLAGIVASLLIITASGVAVGVAFWFMKRTIPELSELPHQVKLYQEVRSDILDRNAILSALDRASTERIQWTPFVNTLLGVLTPDVVLQQATFDSVTKKVSFTGHAASRSSLIVLEGRLKSIPGVVKVVAPASNLLVAQNPVFSFDLTLNRAKLSTDAVDTVPK